MQVMSEMGGWFLNGFFYFEGHGGLVVLVMLSCFLMVFSDSRGVFLWCF